MSLAAYEIHDYDPAQPMIKSFLGAIAFFVCVVAATPSDASTIQINFTGEVDQVLGDSSLTSAFNTSMSMIGSYTFESNAAEVFSSSDPDVTLYALTSFTITIGSYTASSGTDNLLQIQDATSLPYADFYSAMGRSLVGASIGPYEPVTAQLYLTDPSRTALSSSALILTAPDLSLFMNPLWVVSFEPWYGNGESSSYVSGALTSLTVVSASVPDAASTFGLLVFACTGLATANRWRRT